MAVVTTENGIEIHVDEDGRFSASSYGQYFEDRSLSKVKKWTASARPTVTLMEVESDSYRKTRGFRLHENVATVSLDANGKVFGQAPTVPNGRSRYSYTETFRDLYEPDEAAQARIKALNTEFGEWQKEIEHRYKQAFAEIEAMLKPITPERFAELLAEKEKTPA